MFKYIINSIKPLVYYGLITLLYSWLDWTVILIFLHISLIFLCFTTAASAITTYLQRSRPSNNNYSLISVQGLTIAAIEIGFVYLLEISGFLSLAILFSIALVISYIELEIKYKNQKEFEQSVKSKIETIVKQHDNTITTIDESDYDSEVSDAKYVMLD